VWDAIHNKEPQNQNNFQDRVQLKRFYYMLCKKIKRKRAPQNNYKGRIEKDIFNFPKKFIF
jgi:hypothetical protein